MSGKLFIISAPSGAGKTSLVNGVLGLLAPHYAFERVVTYTTKQARQGDVQGVDYHFITPQEFEIKLQQGFFIEYSTGYDHYYGSPRSIIDTLSKGTSLIMVLDRPGAAKVLEQIPTAVLIWITTVEFSDLKKRLEGRGTEAQQQIQRRLEIAQQEVLQEKEHSLYQHHIINDNFDFALERLMIILEGYLR